MALLEHWSSSALASHSCRALCCGAMGAAQPAVAGPALTGHLLGKWKRSFGGVRGQCSLSRHDGAVSICRALPRLGNPCLELAWPLPRFPVSQPGVTIGARKWEEEAVPSSHQCDGDLGHSTYWDALEATSSPQGFWQSTGLLRPSLCAELAP